jgi:hypothetical protein
MSGELLAAVVEFIIAEQFLEELPLRSRRPRLPAYEALKREMLAMADAGERGARAKAARKIAGGNPGKIKAAEDRVYRPTRKRRRK